MTSSPQAPDRLRALKRHLPALAPALVGLWLAWVLLNICLQRFDFPYDIEWMEGGMLVHALRMEQGLPIYTEPSADWIPYIYPPLYPWLISVLGETSYAVGRTLSLVGTGLAAAAAVFALWREGRSPLWGVAAAGLYLSCFDESGTFYDLVRTDALAMGLLAWALVLCRTKTRAGVIAGGLVLVLAFLTKHNFALFGVGIVGWLFWQDRALARDFVLASAAPALIATAWIQVASGGTYLTYLLGVPGSHPLNPDRAWPISEKELLTAFVLLNLVSVGTLLYYAAKRRWSPGGVYWGVTSAIALGASVLMRAHHGGFTNVLMPGHWVMAVGGVMLVASLVRGKPVLAVALGLVVGLQGLEGRYKMRYNYGAKTASFVQSVCVLDRLTGPSKLSECFVDQWKVQRLVPTAVDLQAGDDLIEQLSQIEGTIFAPHFPWYPHLAGKEPSLPLIALWDIQHKRGPYYQDPSVMRQGFAAKKWDAVLCPNKPIKYGLEESYRKAERVDIPATALKTRTGWRVHPAYIWRPKD